MLARAVHESSLADGLAAAGGRRHRRVGAEITADENPDSTRLVVGECPVRGRHVGSRARRPGHTNTLLGVRLDTT
jgi:hypothetical protein